MSRDASPRGQLAIVVVVGLTVLAIPAGFALALPAPATTSGLTPTPPPILNQTDTPTETPTDNGTATPTPTGTPTDSSGGGGDGNGSGDGQRLVVDKGSGATGGVTSEEACSNAEYTTIQRAVDDAAPGDTVVVCAGTYPESVTIETGDLTLRADGDAVIESSGQPAVQTTTPRVTIRGFTIRTTGAEHSIAVGGRDSLVRDNNVELTRANSTGIFLSDGLTSEGAPDPTLGAATGSWVVNNTVNGSDDTFSHGVFADADQTVIQDNTFFAENKTYSIHSAGNETAIRDNTIRHLNPCRQVPFEPNACASRYKPPAILIGEDNKALRNPDWGVDCTPPDGSDDHSNHNRAQQNRVVNNSVSHSPGLGVFISGKGSHTEVLTATKGAVVRNDSLYQTGGISGWTKGAVFQNNIVDVEGRVSGESTKEEGTGEQGMCLHVHNSRIIRNSIDGYGAQPLLVNGGQNITIKENTLTKAALGVEIHPTFLDYEGRHAVESVRFINNQVTDVARRLGTAPGIEIRGANVTEFHHNKITNNGGDGVQISGSESCGGHVSPCNTTVAELHHNNITGNDQTGVVISKNATVTGFHYNLIDNNGRLGIHKENQDKTDGEWPIVNATNNIWGCGGPSSGLEDPYTNRTANGSGDSISAGDEAGKSNVHFDPFFVRPDVDCQSSGSTPTPSPTPSPTPTPTSTPAGPGGDGSGGGGGDGGGPGSGGGDGDNGAGSGDGGGGDSDAPSGGDGEGGDGGETATPPPTSSATPSRTPTASPTPPDTPTPTPAVEPGFGVLTWLVGVAFLVSLLAVRRRSDRDDAESYD